MCYLSRFFCCQKSKANNKIKSDQLSQRVIVFYVKCHFVYSRVLDGEKFTIQNFPTFSHYFPSIQKIVSNQKGDWLNWECRLEHYLQSKRFEKCLNAFVYRLETHLAASELWTLKM